MLDLRLFFCLHWVLLTAQYPTYRRLINKKKINSKPSAINVMNFCIGLLIGFYWLEYVCNKISHRNAQFYPHEMLQMKLRMAIKLNGIPDIRIELYHMCNCTWVISWKLLGFSALMNALASKILTNDRSCW